MILLRSFRTTSLNHFRMFSVDSPPLVPPTSKAEDEELVPPAPPEDGMW